ncbi:MAG: PIN domain-containing protein [Balneolaceae bacterium]
MTYLFCDTCVLLNLATDVKLYDVIAKIIELVENGNAKVIMSDIVQSELTTHKKTIVPKRIASYKGHLKNIKHLYELFSDETEELLKKEIQQIHSDLPKMEDVLNKNLNAILSLAKKSILISHTQENKNNAIQRAIDKEFPFHRNKNSIKDALISETFIDYVKQLPDDCDNIYFITDNVDDFSDTSNKTLPHPDWAKVFQDQVHYSTNIATVINQIEPDAIDKGIEEGIEERSVYTCTDGRSHDFETENGFWKNSMYGGGLSWHYRCKKCGVTYDTGDYWD